MTVKRQSFSPTGTEDASSQIKPLDVSQFKPKPPKRTDQPTPEARVGQGAPVLPEARDIAIAATKAGFTSRTGVKIDGRSMRRTGRDVQLNAKVEQAVKDAIVIEAARRGIAVGQLIKEMFEVYSSAKEGEGEE